MFIKKDSINNVLHEFFVFKYGITYLTHNGIIHYSYLKGNEWHYKCDTLYGLIRFDDKYLCHNGNLSSYVISEKGEMLFESEDYPNSWEPSLLKNNFILSYFSSNQRVVGIFNLTNNQYLWKRNEKIGKNVKLLNDVLVFTEKRKLHLLKALSFWDGSNYWQLDISDIGHYTNKWGDQKKGEVIKIIGSYSGIIWVSITNHTLLGLKEETGEIIHHLRDIPEFNCTWLPSAIPDEHSMILDENKGKILGFRWEFYWEIDCNTGIIKLWDLTDGFKKSAIRNDSPQYEYDGSFIYFLQQQSGKIGIFDTQQKKIIWQYTLGDGSVMLTQIKYKDDKLFVLDAKHTLHIFEKE